MTTQSDTDHGFSASLFAICQAMGSSLEIDEVLDTIIDLTVRTLKSTSGSILLYESGSDDLRMLASRGLPDAVVERGHIPRKGGIAEWVIENNEPRIVGSQVDTAAGLDSVVRGRSIKSALCVPLRAQGRVIGILNLNREGADDQEFGQDDLQTLVILASQAAICIENARLHRENLERERLAAIGTTAAKLAHLIKNMLTGLRGGLGLVEMARDTADWDTVEKGSTILRRSVDRMSFLSLDMLDFSREKTPVRHDTNIDELTRDVLDTTAYKAEQKSVSLHSDIAPDCSPFPLDANQFFLCLLNLVENALDSVPSNGSVTLNARRLEPAEAIEIFGDDGDTHDTGRVLRLTVADDGHGIDPDKIDDIFRPFFSTKASRGTGLGLAVTHKLVIEHGGKIIVESEPGQGTAFHVIIPERSPAPNPS